MMLPQAIYAERDTALEETKPPRAPSDLRASRVLDIVLASLLLVAFAPLMLVVAIAVSAFDGGPALFGHMRFGHGGRYFKCLKFRTMMVDADARLQELLRTDPAALREWQRDHKLRRDPRITKLGVFLRKSSLDELPQLFNVFTGDMSLVGPRPIVTAEISRYGRYIDAYCSVRPGITGLWQVSGRNDVSYRRRVALDVLYSRNQSLRLYFVILARTLPAVLVARGAS